MLAQRRYIEKDPAEGPTCFQLFGNDPQELAETTKIVTDLGADLIDLNCGCPARKVRRQGAGSSLLLDAPKLYQMLLAMKQNTHLPVSVKIRVEGGSSDKFNAEIAKVVNDSGVDFLVVHGRHWNEHYETPCNYDEIRFFVEQVKIPVIGNGDIFDIASLKKMLATGCAGAMIARGGVGQPWLIRNLIAEMRGEEVIVPTPQEVAAVFIEHIVRLSSLLGNERCAVLHARKIAKYYARNLPSQTRKVFCIAVNACDNLPDFRDLCLRYFN